MDAQFSYIQATPSSGKESIYDIAFNHYGNRLAMCSSDHLVTVWNKVNDWKEWKKAAEWKAHKSPSLKITWIHPEFGQALATCTDRSVAIWEEMLDNDHKIDQSWVQKACLMGSGAFITDIKFGPKSVGLLLAICSSDGFIKIFKALDILDLSRWGLLQEVCYKHRARCITWNPNCSNENYSLKYFKINSIDDINESNKYVGSIYSLYPRIVDEPNVCLVISQEPMLVVGFDDDDDCKTEDKLKILLYASRYQRWSKTKYSIKDKYLSEITNAISDLAFAARLGRAYDLLAVASKDIKMYALYHLFSQSQSSFKFQLCLLYSFPSHNSSIFRINWNSVGNILISAGDDGYVRLWKQYQVLNEKEEIKASRQKTSFRSKHLQYCWKTVRIIKILDLKS